MRGSFVIYVYAWNDKDKHGSATMELLSNLLSRALKQRGAHVGVDIGIPPF